LTGRKDIGGSLTTLSIPSTSALQRWELYHGTGQIIDGIHIVDPERTSGIRRYQILKIQRQRQSQCHVTSVDSVTRRKTQEIQEDKTYRARPAPPANPWQSKQMKKIAPFILTRLVPVVLSYQALIQRTSQGSVRHAATFDGFAWGNLLYGPIIQTVNAMNNSISSAK
jgi:hypothetical protein